MGSVCDSWLVGFFGQALQHFGGGHKAKSAGQKGSGTKARSAVQPGGVAATGLLQADFTVGTGIDQLLVGIDALHRKAPLGIAGETVIATQPRAYFGEQRVVLGAGLIRHLNARRVGLPARRTGHGNRDFAPLAPGD